MVVGIALDEDIKPVQEMVTAKGMSWPQLSDPDEKIQKLFDIKGTPTYYLIDREGKIAAKDIPFKKLSEAVIELLKR